MHNARHTTANVAPNPRTNNRVFVVSSQFWRVVDSSINASTTSVGSVTRMTIKSHSDCLFDFYWEKENTKKSFLVKSRFLTFTCMHRNRNRNREKTFSSLTFNLNQHDSHFHLNEKKKSMCLFTFGAISRIHMRSKIHKSEKKITFQTVGNVWRQKKSQ